MTLHSYPDDVVDIVCDWIKEDVEQEAFEMIEKLPQEILNGIEISKSDVNVEGSDVEGDIKSYGESSLTEYDHYERDYDYGMAGEIDVLDYIFK